MLLASFFSVVIQPPMAVHVCWHVIPPSSLIFLLNCSKLSSFILSARLFIFSFIPSASLHNFSVKSGPPCSRMSTKTNVEGGGPVEAEVVRRARPQRSTVALGTMVEGETPQQWGRGAGNSKLELWTRTCLTVECLADVSTWFRLHHQVFHHPVNQASYIYLLKKVNQA